MLFYLRFTDYAGIGLLEAIMIITAVFTEIPTGAIADLLGKKNTLLVAYLIGAIGNLVMGFAPTFFWVSFGVIIATLGGSLSSGTVEALLYDSLLSIKQQKKYEKILGNISSIRMATLGIVALLGGYMYSISPGLPFIAVGLMKLIAFGIGLFLTEPPIDTETFSLKNYLVQTKSGFRQFFTKRYLRQHLALLLITAIIVMNGHMLIDIQLVDIGWNEKQLGFIATGMYVFSSLMGQLAPVLSKKIGTVLTNLLSAVTIAITMIVISLFSPLLATLFVVTRNGVIEIFGNTASMIINAHTISKYRATTLSTYTMLSNIPYVIGAFAIGKAMEIWSVNQIISILGLLLLLIVLLATLMVPKKIEYLKD